MRSDYNERLERKLESAEELALKNKQISEERLAAADRIIQMIPLGQPILVGHHSEKGHRANLKRIDNNFRKGFEAQRKVEHYQSRVKHIKRQLEGKGPISSDDPEAVQRLTEKIAKLLEAQEVYKKINLVIRKNAKAGKDAQVEAIMRELSFSQRTAEDLLVSDFAGCIGIPNYEIRNNSANIRRLKERLAVLEADTGKDYSEQEINGVRVVESVEDNRLQLYFSGKPDEVTREKLKRNGFRWAGSIGCWQRHLSNGARYAAKKVLELERDVKND